MDALSAIAPDTYLVLIPRDVLHLIAEYIRGLSTIVVRDKYTYELPPLPSAGCYFHTRKCHTMFGSDRLIVEEKYKPASGYDRRRLITIKPSGCVITHDTDDHNSKYCESTNAFCTYLRSAGRVVLSTPCGRVLSTMSHDHVNDCIPLLNPCPSHRTRNLCTRFLVNGAIAAYSHDNGQFIISCIDDKQMHVINVPYVDGHILAVDRTNAHTVVLVRNDRSVSVLLYAGSHVADRCMIMRDYVHGLRLYATSDSEFAVVCINKRKKGPITVHRFTIRAKHVFFCISHYETYYECNAAASIANV